MQVKEKVAATTLKRDKGKEVLALFDTGAKFTYISDSVGKEFDFKPYEEPKEVQLAVKGVRGRILGEVSLIFRVVGCEMPLPVQAYVVQNLSEEAVVGTNFMEGFEVELDLEKGKAKLKKRPPEVRII